jgi:hypothetical protein
MGELAPILNAITLVMTVISKDNDASVELSHLRLSSQQRSKQLTQNRLKVQDLLLALLLA